MAVIFIFRVISLEEKVCIFQVIGCETAGFSHHFRFCNFHTAVSGNSYQLAGGILHKGKIPRALGGVIQAVAGQRNCHILCIGQHFFNYFQLPVGKGFKAVYKNMGVVCVFVRQLAAESNVHILTVTETFPHQAGIF